MDSKIEQGLVERAKKDPEEFAEIYQHYYPHIRRFFSVKLSKANVVDDLTSTTFEKALKNIEKFKWQGFSFSSWLYRIAANTLTDYFRKQKPGRNVSMADLQLKSDLKGPEEQTELDLDSDLLRKVLKELPERERSIIYMKFFDGYTNSVIAQSTGLTHSNVSTIIYRSLSKIRKLLNDNGL